MLTRWNPTHHLYNCINELFIAQKLVSKHYQTFCPCHMAFYDGSGLSHDIVLIKKQIIRKWRKIKCMALVIIICLIKHDYFMFLYENHKASFFHYILVSVLSTKLYTANQASLTLFRPSNSCFWWNQTVSLTAQDS